MRTNDPCPRCGRRELLRLPAPRLGEQRLEGARLAAFLVWPGAAILLLAGYVPSFIVLTLLGLEPAQSAILLLAAAVGAGLLGATLWAVTARQSARPLADRLADPGRFCPCCETAFPAAIRSRQSL